MTKKKKKHKERYCNFCSRIYSPIFDGGNVFHDFIIDERDFIHEFNECFKEKSLFFLDICHIHSLFICTKKLKFLVVHMVKILKAQINFSGPS